MKQQHHANLKRLHKFKKQKALGFNRELINLVERGGAIPGRPGKEAASGKVDVPVIIQVSQSARFDENSSKRNRKLSSNEGMKKVHT